MRARVRAKRGLRDIRKLMRKTGKAKARIGILKGTADHPGGGALALIAMSNEFGVADKIPPRPFLHNTIREHQHYKGDLKKALQLYLRGLKTAKAALTPIGEQAAMDVRLTILSVKSPPNAPSTEKKKGFNDPLVDKGYLEKSIDSEVVA